MPLTMTDQDVIFLRPTPEEKAVIAAAAAQNRRSLNIYVLDAAIEKARQDLGVLADSVLPRALKRTCLHCGRPLTRGNKSGFCRICQRTVGLPTLQKLHPKEVVSHGKSSPSPPRTRKRRD